MSTGRGRHAPILARQSFSDQDEVNSQSSQPGSSLNLRRRRRGAQAAVWCGAPQVAPLACWPLSSGPTTILWVLRSALSRCGRSGARSAQGSLLPGGGGRMEVRFVSDEGIQQHPVEDLASLLAREDGLVWVDI